MLFSEDYVFVTAEVALWVCYLSGDVELPSPCVSSLSSRWFAFGLMVEVSLAVSLSLTAAQKLTRNLG